MSTRRALIGIGILLAILLTGSVEVSGMAPGATNGIPRVLGMLFSRPTANNMAVSTTTSASSESIRAATAVSSDSLTNTAADFLGEILGQIVSGGGDDTHAVCQAQSCVLVAGEGLNQCDSDAECTTSHKACRGLSCVTVPEPGVDECASSAGCAQYANNAVPFHKACSFLGLGYQCTLVAGAGPNLCTLQSDCIAQPDGPCTTPGSCGGEPPPVVPGILPGAGSTALSCPVTTLPNQCISSEFFSGHPWGVDIGTGGIGGTPVYAFAEGDTFNADPPIPPGCGGATHAIAIRLTSNPALTLTYCHTIPSVPVGTHVTAGQQVGTVSTTATPGELAAGWSGPHLHFEIREAGHVSPFGTSALSPRDYVTCFQTLPHC